MPRRRRTITDAPTEPLPPAGSATREYEYVEQDPGPPPPGPPRRAWYDQIGWALLVLLILVAVGLAIWWFAVHDQTSKKTVPSVTGSPVPTAVNVLQDRGFTVRIVSVAHPEQRGIVFRQIPTAGTRLAAGSTVQLTASNGPSTAVVPNAVGLTQTEGRDRLVAAGFTVTESRLFNDAEPGMIVAQTPPAGSKVAKDSTVHINVSRGSATVVVPNVVGMSLGEAETQLAKAGLKPAVQLRVPSAQPAGTVVAQNPPGGQAKRGSRVGLNVSTGSAAGPTGPTGTG